MSDRQEMEHSPRRRRREPDVQLSACHAFGSFELPRAPQGLPQGLQGLAGSSTGGPIGPGSGPGAAAVGNNSVPSTPPAEPADISALQRWTMLRLTQQLTRVHVHLMQLMQQLTEMQREQRQMQHNITQQLHQQHHQMQVLNNQLQSMGQQLQRLQQQLEVQQRQGTNWSWVDRW